MRGLAKWLDTDECKPAIGAGRKEMKMKGDARGRGTLARREPASGDFFFKFLNFLGILNLQEGRETHLFGRKGLFAHVHICASHPPLPVLVEAARYLTKQLATG